MYFTSLPLSIRRGFLRAPQCTRPPQIQGRAFPFRAWPVILLLLLPFLTVAQTGSTSLVISQVYGGGGNSGATYKNDFIELHNVSNAPISVAGYSVQYTSAGGNTWTRTDLITSTILTTGTIPAGGYFLIQQGAGTGGTLDLPSPDAIGTLTLSATSGKIALVSNTTSLTGTCPSGSSLIDLVGFGGSATTTGFCFEGTGPTPAPSNSTSVSRKANGCTDTNVNSADFTAGPVTPRNSASPAVSCVTSTTPAPTGFTPDSGPVGTTLTITGSNLSAITGVTVGGIPATTVTASAGTVKATVAASTPAGSAGVVLSDGTSTYPVPGSFTVTTAPTTSLSTPTLGSATTCPGGTLSVTFQATGTYTAGNTFTVELSDASGTFAASPPVLASVSNSTSPDPQTVTAMLPTGTPGGLTYKVRVVASNPATQSAPSTAFSVSSVRLSPTSAQSVYTSENGSQLTATETTSPTGGRQWVYATRAGGPYTALPGETAATYTPRFTGEGTYYVAVQSSFACGALTSNEVAVTVTAPPVPLLTAISSEVGAAGTQLLLSGSGFTSTATVSFNGLPADQVFYVSSTQLYATVPTGATTGPVRVTTPYGTATSATAFTGYALDQTLLDAFTRPNADVVGDSWTETETSAAGAKIAGNQLRLSGSTSGREFVVRDLSNRYNPVLGSNDRVLSWAWNMQQSRVNPAGFDATSYGVAYVLAASSDNLLTGVGYAVILGNSGTPDPIKLVRFSNGLSANRVLATVSTNGSDYTNKPLTLRVLFDPATNRWALEAGTSTGAFQDPLTATYTPLGNAIDDTYATTALPYSGAFWNHATTGTEYALFDNVAVTAPCTPAAEPAAGSALSSVDRLTTTTADLSWEAGPAASRLVVLRQGSGPATPPTDGTTYQASNIWGSGSPVAAGQYAVSFGSLTAISLTGLQPNTTYSYAIYEAEGSGCATNYQPVSAATGTFTTEPCVLAALPPTPASQGTASAPDSYRLDLNWISGDGAERLVVVRDGEAPQALPVDGTAYAANARLGGGATLAPNEYVVYRGTGTRVTVTGLAPGRTYYAVVYELNGESCSSRYLTADPATSSALTPVPVPGTYRFYRGNLHAHSSYSDGNKDAATSGAATPYDDYGVARLAENFDFLGISEHNHEAAGMLRPSYAKGLLQADQANQDGTFLALYGMEWGTISGGGHVVVYGYNQLIGWEPGNYDVFVQKGDYTGPQGLFATLAQTSGAVAYLAHPNSSDYNNLLTSPLNPTASQVVVGMAMRSGPAFSTATDYSEASSSTYEPRYKDALKQGYHVGPTMDHDNHNSTFGRTNYSRLVVLSPELTRPAVLEALQQRRFYAADDANVEVTLTVGQQPMGSQLTLPGAPTLDVTVVDPDNEAVTSIELVAGIPGSGEAATTLTTTAGAATLRYTDPIPNGATYYYYAVITQADGDKVWTAPIRYTRRDPDGALPVTLTSFSAVVQGQQQAVLRWVTAQELHSAAFVVERSLDGRTFVEAGRLRAAGTSTTPRTYQWQDPQPLAQLTYYRLRQLDENGTAHQSAVRALSPRDREERQAQVFPNPTAGQLPQLSLRGYQQVSVQVQVLNMLGQVVDQQQVTPGTYLQQVPLTLPAGLPAGVYHVRVLGGGETRQCRLLLTH